MLMVAVHANEFAHQHAAKDQAIHEKFYSTWMMPDNRTVSCCNKKDCSPAETYWLNGHWMAHKVDDLNKKFVPIPEGKVEMEDILKLIVGEPRHGACFHDLRHAGHDFTPAFPRKI